jgi:dTDP-4-dehydrorhamnose 3,5-epimerase
METYRMDRFDELGVWRPFVQQNQSHSQYGVLRGLHYQLRSPQAKLVRVPRGKVRDVVVDVRWQSSTYGRYAVVELSEENHRMLYVPRGYAHGYLVLSDTATFEYLCDEYYGGPDDQFGIRWDDPDLDIPWNITDPILSAKDAALPFLEQVSVSDLPQPDP